MTTVDGRYGDWALIAGAAEGLGEGFCRLLASRGINIILVDKNLQAMNILAVELEQTFHIKTRQLNIDLALAEAAGECMNEASLNDCRLLIYVAAFSKVSRFTDLNRDELHEFISVNSLTLLYLVHDFSKRLISGRKTGGILLVSSLAGLIGPQYVAAYAATKAFSIQLTEALSGELKEHGIDITVCCSGTVSTPTYWKSKPLFEKLKPPVMQPGEVARYALNKLGLKTMCIPGFKNRLQYFFLMNLIPRRLASKFVNKAMYKMYGTQIMDRNADSVYLSSNGT